MKHNLVPIRPAMTAIAAVIALSSTPLLAQTAAAPDAQSAPPVVTAPAPAPEPVAPASVAQTATPDVAAPTTVQPAPQPAMKTMSTPVEHVEESTAAPVAQNVGNAPVRRNAATTASSTSHTAVRTTSSAPSAATLAPKAAPVAKTIAAPEAPAPAPKTVAATPAAPAPAATATSARTNSSTTEDETLPIAGAIGLGVIALGGGAYAMRRRKHREQHDELLLETPLEAGPVMAAEPVTVAPRAAEPFMAAPAVVAEAGPDRLPNGFDLSRFGRHTRAAYLGPTPENPSLSLRHRLRRASFFDQREREAVAAGATLKEPVPTPTKTAQPAEADNGQVTIRLAPNGKSSRFSYVLQR